MTRVGVGALAALGLAFMMVAAACGTSDDPVVDSPTSVPTASAGPASSATQTPATPVALDLLKRSNDLMRELTNFRATVTSEIRTIGDRFSVVSRVSRSDDGTVRVVTTRGSAEGSNRLEVIIALPHVYMNLPDRRWVRTTGEEFSRTTGQDLSVYAIDFFGELFPTDEVPWELYSAEYLGSEELDGVPTDHLGISLDIQEVLTRFDAEQRQRFFGATVLAEPPEDVAGEIRVTGVEVWIDSEGRSRKFKGEILGGGVFATLQIEAFAFDEEIAIQLPQDFEESLAAAVQPPAPALLPPPSHGFDLAGMVLTLEEVTAEYPQLALDGTTSGRQSGRSRIAGTIDPTDTIDDLVAAGRVDGYMNFFLDAAVVSGSVVGRPAGFTSDVELYETEEQAAAAVARELTDYRKLSGQEVEQGVVITRFDEFEAPNVGSHAFAAQVVVNSEGSDQAVTLDFVTWNRGPIVASVNLVWVDDRERPPSLDRVSLKMDALVVQALAERP